MKKGDDVICKKCLMGTYGEIAFSKEKSYFVDSANDTKVSVNSDILSYNPIKKQDSPHIYGFYFERDWKFLDYFYTPEEIKNKNRTKLIDEMLNERV